MQIVNNEVLFLKSVENENVPDEYTSLFRQKNFKTKLVRVLMFQNINAVEIKHKLETPELFRGIIFTSPRAILSTKESLCNTTLKPEWHNKQNYVIGEKSKSLAQQLFNLNCFGEDTGNANNLAQLILIHNTGDARPFLFPCGNIKRGVLKTELLKKDVRLEEVTVYETKVNPNVEEELLAATEHLHLIPGIFAYFSPSGVQASKQFVEEHKLASKIRFVAIGPTTAEEIQKNDWQVSGAAIKPTPESLLQVVESINFKSNS